MKNKKTRKLTTFSIICIIQIIITTPTLAVKEYNVITTLTPSTPRGFGGYGGDIAMDGGLCLIGEWRGVVEDIGVVGKAYLYDADWNLQMTLRAPEPEPNALFSHSVDIQGDTIVIGCPFHNVNGSNNVGEVYVFDLDGSLRFTLHSPEPKKAGGFGVEVAIGKDIILVGETGGLVEGFLAAGAVHVYGIDGAYITSLVSPDMKHNGAFGDNIAANEEYILVGEPGTTGSSLNIVGSIHVFDYDWKLIKTIQAPGQVSHTMFGKSIAIRGETVVIGEIFSEADGHERAGKAYIYDTDWNLVATLQSTAPRDGGEFGRGTVIGGDLIVVGERRGDVVTMKEGKAYVYDPEGNLETVLTSPEPAVGAQFGYSIASDGEILVVSDVEGTVEGVPKAGKVHVYGLGEPAAEQPAPEEETTETESEPESDESGGIPGFPPESVILSIVLAVLSLWLIQRQR